LKFGRYPHTCSLTLTNAMLRVNGGTDKSCV
jgi:hypothetical protein